MQSERRQVGSGAPWEASIGYARAVRVGAHVMVAGTTATAPDGTVIAPADAYGQAIAIFEIIGRALTAVGASWTDVVRTRVYLVAIADWSAVGRAHGEIFGAIRPASTMVAVASLIDPAHLVEIEVDAIVDPPRVVDGVADLDASTPTTHRT